MWKPNGKRVPTDRLQPFEPVDVLYEFDGPRIFTLNDADGELCLAYWSDEEDDVCRYVVVPVSRKIVDGVVSGSLSVLESLNQPRCWICDVSLSDEIVGCQLVDFADIPPDSLPTPGTMLLPSLEPLLTLRAIGDDIVPGRIPGSVIRVCVEGVQKTFKFLSEYVLGKQPQAGRPDEFLRRLFDLPTQRIAFASFEVSFRMPIEERNLFTASGQRSPESETLEEVKTLLNKGLKWLTTAAGEEGVYSPDDAEESAVVLRALKELTPSSQGSIERMELKGQLIGPRSTSLVLDRSARQRVNAAIRNRSLEPQLVDLEGRIRELDKDRLSFELREIEGTSQMQRFVFDEDILEEVFQAFQDDVRVRVAGTMFPVRNVAYAFALSQVQAAPPDDVSSS